MVTSVLSIPLPLETSSRRDPEGSRNPRPQELPFLAGPENYVAAAAVTSFFETDSAERPPLVFYGPVGTGKTHLALGLATAWKQYFPGQAALYVTGAEFARDVADAIDRKSTTELRRKYRQLVLLVLDGLEGLVSKPAAQGELLHTIDVIRSRQGQVVVTSRQFPAGMSRLVPALRGRLSEGLNVCLALPGPEARLALVEHLAESRGIQLSRRAARALAGGLPVVAPRLLAALGELHVAARERGRAIDLKLVRRYTREQASAGGSNLRGIAGIACRHFGIKLAELRGPSRRQSVVAARGAVVYLARRLTNHSLDQIGQFLGGRDHTTMLHAYRRTEELLERDGVLRQAMTEMQGALESGRPI